MAEWRPHSVLKLIELYQGCPVLWDPKEKDYKNVQIKENMWSQVAQQMNLPIADCKKKMQTLQGRYKQKGEKVLVKKNKTTKSKSDSETDDACEAKWFTYKSFHILDETTIPQKKRKLKTQNNEIDSSLSSSASKGVTENTPPTSQEANPPAVLPPLAAERSADTPSTARDLYNLQWSEYSTKFSATCSSLREAHDLVDVTLGVKGRYIQAHKLVLSVCSDYFKELFKMNPCQHPIVILKDVEYDYLSAVVQFMYCGKVEITADKLPGVLRVAQLLEVKGLSYSTEQLPNPIPNKTSSSTEMPPPSPTPAVFAARPLKPIQAASATSNTDSRKRRRPSISSEVKLKILRCNGSNATASGEAPRYAHAGKQRIADLPVIAVRECSTSIAAPNTSIDKPEDTVKTYLVEMFPLDLKHEAEVDDESLHQVLELVSEVKGEMRNMDELEWETIQDSDEELDETGFSPMATK